MIKNELDSERKKMYSPPSAECLELEPTGLLVSRVFAGSSKPVSCFDFEDETGFNTSKNLVGSNYSVRVRTKNDDSESLTGCLIRCKKIN